GARAAARARGAVRDRGRPARRRRLDRRPLPHGLGLVTELLRYALPGLGIGGIYALLGLGMVVIYRGSGVINFAHSGFALVGAYLVYDLQTVHGYVLALSLATSVVMVAVLGVVYQLV